MKKILTVCVAAMVSLTTFSQKTETVTVDCNGSPMTFTAIRLGEPTEVKFGGMEYFYALENNKAVFYVVKGYKGTVSGVDKYIVTVNKDLKTAKFQDSETIVFTNFSSGGETIKESQSCENGNKKVSKDMMTYLYVFSLPAKTKADFETVLAKINATVAEQSK